MANLSIKGVLTGNFADVCNQKFLDLGTVLGQQCDAFSPNQNVENTVDQVIGGPSV